MLSECIVLSNESSRKYFLAAFSHLVANDCPCCFAKIRLFTRCACLPKCITYKVLLRNGHPVFITALRLFIFVKCVLHVHKFRLIDAVPIIHMYLRYLPKKFFSGLLTFSWCLYSAWDNKVSFDTYKVIEVCKIVDYRTQSKMFMSNSSSPNVETQWPPRSPDLTAWDYFMLAHLKCKVIVDKSRNI